MSRFLSILVLSISSVMQFGTANAQSQKIGEERKTSNPLVTALWFSHLYALPEKLTPAKDRDLKNTLISTLQKDAKSLAWDDVRKEFDHEIFSKIADRKSSLSVGKMEELVREQSGLRQNMFPKLRQHADLLTTQFDMIEPRHFDAAEKLKSWVIKNYQADKPLEVIIVCTGNSRRSMIGSTMGNIAASYYGMNNIRFYSGGTTPTAFNPRTITALREIGIEIENTGTEAARGKSGDVNPVYRVKWGKGLETDEYSKTFGDPRNPKKGFAAVLVCTEADDACPIIKGADVRISLPYMDPKIYDGTPFEPAKYAERRDDVGRLMLSVMMQASRQLKPIK